MLILRCLPVLLFALASVAQIQPPEGDNAAAPFPIAVTRSAGLNRHADGFVGHGAGFRATFSSHGIQFAPALGAATATARRVALRPSAVHRGRHLVQSLVPIAPAKRDLTAVYEHAPGMRERYEVGPDGVALSWVFDHRPAGRGDLVVRYAVDSNLPGPTRTADGGLVFGARENGGVTVGAVTGIDAAGRTVAGDIRFVDGVLELALPAAFVDAASYPLVLDPLIGPAIGQSSGSFAPYFDPEVAYDASTDRWLVVFKLSVSSSSVDLLAQRINSNGTLAGSLSLVASGVDAGSPRVANLAARDRFGIVWRQQDPTGPTIRFAALSASGGGPTHTLTVASTFTGDLLDPDIGADTNAPIGSNRGFVAVYEDTAIGAIQARRIYFTATDQLVSPSATSVFTDGPVTSYSQPAISRAGASANDLLIVARRSIVLITQSRAISARTIASDTGALGPASVIDSSTTSDLTVPDVDGWSGRWIVTWRRFTSTLGVSGIELRTVELDPAGGSALVVGSSASVGGSFVATVRRPTIGYTPGRSWLGYQETIATDRFQIEALDSGSLVDCADGFTAAGVSGQRIATATGTSGGATHVEDALAVWSDGFNVWAQRLRNHGTAGSYANLGGGCGNGGTPLFWHEPGIGSSGLVCSVVGLPTNSLLTVFNLSPPGSPLSCGACAWTPFAVTATRAVVAGQASIEFPIPCLPTLIGSQFEVQWTTLAPGQVPCALFPDFVVSDRTLMTIDN